MRNPGMIKNISVKCMAAIMGAAAAMSPVTAAVGIVIEADAQHYDEWTAPGGTVTSEDTVGVNRGTIDDNYGTVATNAGTISTNHSGGTVVNNNSGGIITTNEGNVETNSAGGTVSTNSAGGIVTDNYGRVDADFGLVGTNYSGGSVFVNSGGELGVYNGGSVAFESGAKLLLNTTDGITISGYTVENNSGANVYINNGGTIVNNSGPGVTVNSGGIIVNNYGSSAIVNSGATIENNSGNNVTVNSGGTIENNSGTLVTVNSGGRLVTNNGSGVTNNAGGTIVTNNGINVMNAGGSIEFNNGEVTNTSGGTVGNNLRGATVSGGIIGNNYGSAIDVNEVTNNWAGGSVTGDDSIVINNYGGSVSNQENIQNSYPANPGPMYPVQPAAPSDRNGETVKAAEPVQSLGSPGTITSGGIQVSVNPAVTLQNKISDSINSQLKGVAGSKTGGIMAAGQVLTAHVDMGQQSNFTSEMIGVLQSATDQNIAVVMAVKYKGNELELTIQPHSDLSGVQAYLQQSGEKVAGVMCVHALTPKSTLTNNTTHETHINNMLDSDIPGAVGRAVANLQTVTSGGFVSATGITDAN